MLSGRGLCDGLITRPEESYLLWCVVCDLETSRIGAPYIYDISSLRVKQKTDLTLTSLSQWFYISQLMLNIAKTNVIKFTPKTTAHVPLDIYYKDNVIDEVKEH